MFSFQQIEDMVLNDMNQQDLLEDHHDPIPMDPNINHQNKSMRKHHDPSSFTNPSSSTPDGIGDGKDDHTNKKLIRRETEKQRRKQMANLYASLRSILPVEFIRGKRSTLDQTEQAVNYIKYMEENIKVLGVKRDQLKNFMGIISMNTNENLESLLHNTVVVNSCNGAIEILINSCSKKDGFQLSRVLKTLVQEGLNIINCTSTKANDRFLHTIQCEAINHIKPIDPSLLQQRLTSVANARANLE